MFYRERFRSCPDTWLLDVTPVIFQCSYDQADFRDCSFLTRSIPKPDCLWKARRGRQAEYLAGRYAAKQVLEKLGYPSAQVRADDDRVPVWPRQIRGSISHTGSEAICAAIESECPTRSIGIDVERCLSPARMAPVRELVATRSERRLVSARCLPESWALTLFFSAKESLFKAVYPLARKGFDFRAAEVIALDARRKTLTVRLRQMVDDRFPEGWMVRGHYLTDAGHVITMVIL